MKIHQWNSRMLLFILGFFIIAYACVVVKNSRNVNIQQGPKRENTRDTGLKIDLMEELDSIQQNQEILINELDTLNKL